MKHESLPGGVGSVLSSSLGRGGAEFDLAAACRGQGLTARIGINDRHVGRHRFERTVYDGRRLRDPVLRSQSNGLPIGPIFYLVKATFRPAGGAAELARSTIS